ncbi:MAG: polyprenyl synthetase family protein [Bacteroidetes bacterium]|nr:polyprenyl synthetase family protein [Bacteroidota bacterium]
MYTKKELQDVISAAFQTANFHFQPLSLYDPIKYMMELGGKRLRPLLTLISCDLFGGKIEDALAPAMGLELFHNFTLLHDDIMDHAPLRRGKETVFKKWNTNSAILSGDTLFVMAYELVTKTTPSLLPQVLELFNDTARKVCEGQQYDMDYEFMAGISIDDYILMIRLKTAVLISCSLKLGAIIAKAPEEEANLIYAFGENLGLAFQLQDDYLDVFGEVDKFGKEIGNDIVTNKKTFLYLKAFELAGGNSLELLKNNFNKRSLSARKKVNIITEIYKELQIDILTRSMIDEYFTKAIEIMSRINIPEDRKQILLEIAGQMVNRET